MPARSMCSKDAGDEDIVAVVHGVDLDFESTQIFVNEQRRAG